MSCVNLTILKNQNGMANMGWEQEGSSAGLGGRVGRRVERDGLYGRVWRRVERGGLGGRVGRRVERYGVS